MTGTNTEKHILSSPSACLSYTVVSVEDVLPGIRWQKVQYAFMHCICFVSGRILPSRTERFLQMIEICLIYTTFIRNKSHGFSR